MQRSNVYLYGPTGCGKTTFVTDCLRALAANNQQTQLTLPPIFVDCVELYSEKLISNYVSLCLDNQIRKLLKDHAGDSKTLKRMLAVKTCKNFPGLLDMLQDLNEAFSEAHKCGHFSKYRLDGLSFFFYLVVDNASSVFQQER